MTDYFDRVKEYVLDLDLTFVREDAGDELIVVDDEERGIKGLIIDCEDPILVLEQFILRVPKTPGDLFR
ncbi:MAG: molecular chaperone Tir, partial [Acidobacteriota bacterium]